jgi:hypothetical protein
MSDPLIPLAVLERTKPQLFALVEQLAPRIMVDVRDGSAGAALAFSLLFEHWEHWGTLLEGVTLDPAARLYNRYFWFRRFATLWQQAHGYDAGTEQQAFQILENSEAELDWTFVAELDERASSAWVP